MSHIGFLVDANNCIGCKTCVIACKDANNHELGCGFRQVHTFCTGEYPDVGMYHISMVPTEPLASPKTGEFRNCDYCAALRAEGEDPACVAACPMRAIEWGDLEEICAGHEDVEIATELPAFATIETPRGDQAWIVKDCMMDSDFDKVNL